MRAIRGTYPLSSQVPDFADIPLAFIGSPRREMLRTKLDLRCRGVSITRFEGSRLRLATDAGPYGESNLTTCVKRSSSTWISRALERASLIMTGLMLPPLFWERKIFERAHA